jgi:hypothetical protein
MPRQTPNRELGPDFPLEPLLGAKTAVVELCTVHVLAARFDDSGQGAFSLSRFLRFSRPLSVLFLFELLALVATVLFNINLCHLDAGPVFVLASGTK